MKTILSIIISIFLFVIFGLIIWASFSPETFSSFFSIYPTVNKTAVQVGVLNIPFDNSQTAITPEPEVGLTGQITINGNIWLVEIVDNNEDRSQGLSNRTILYSKKGMLFVFEQMSFQSFWMKDMLIPLDIIFLDDNWKIVDIEVNLRADSFPKIFGQKVKSQYVLEMNAGEATTYNLAVGDQATFRNK